MVWQVLYPLTLVDVCHGGETCSYIYELQQSALWLQMIPFPERPLLNLIQDHAIACLQMLWVSSDCIVHTLPEAAFMQGAFFSCLLQRGRRLFWWWGFCWSCECLLITGFSLRHNTSLPHCSFVLMYLLVHSENSSKAILYFSAFIAVFNS